MKSSTLLILAALALAACATAVKPVAQVPAAPAALDDYSGSEFRDGRVFTLDPAASRIRIYAFRGGRAAGAGHNHVLSAPAFSGFVYLPGRDYAGARFNLQFRLDQLVIDEPQARRETGGTFSGEVDAGAIEGTREHLLGPRSLDADRFLLVTVRSVAVAGEIPRLVATVELNLHGVSRELLVPLTVGIDGEVLSVSGELAIRQSDFGAEPYSLLGGLIAVQDPVAIEFRLAGRLRH